MRYIPLPILKAKLSENRICARAREKTCRGNLTIEHSLLHKGLQVQKLFALLWLCEYHHGVGLYQDNGDLNKELNEYLALKRATGEELEEISGAIDYQQRLKYLSKKYENY